MSSTRAHQLVPPSNHEGHAAAGGGASAHPSSDSGRSTLQARTHRSDDAPSSGTDAPTEPSQTPLAQAIDGIDGDHDSKAVAEYSVVLHQFVLDLAFAFSIHRVLHAMQLPVVPYPTQAHFERRFGAAFRRASARAAPPGLVEDVRSGRVAPLFVGQLSALTTAEQLFATVAVLGGSAPVFMQLCAVKQQPNRRDVVASRNVRCAVVYVDAARADDVIARLNQRVLFDEACWVYAADDADAAALAAHCALLKDNQFCRYETRPYARLVVWSAELPRSDPCHGALAECRAAGRAPTAFPPENRRQDRFFVPLGGDADALQARFAGALAYVDGMLREEFAESSTTTTMTEDEMFEEVDTVLHGKGITLPDCLFKRPLIPLHSTAITYAEKKGFDAGLRHKLHLRALDAYGAERQRRANPHHNHNQQQQ